MLQTVNQKMLVPWFADDPENQPNENMFFTLENIPGAEVCLALK